MFVYALSTCKYEFGSVKMKSIPAFSGASCLHFWKFHPQPTQDERAQLRPPSARATSVGMMKFPTEWKNKNQVEKKTPSSDEMFMKMFDDSL